MKLAPGFKPFRRFTLGRADVAPEIDRELEFHLAEATRELMATGLPERAAREEALSRFGSLADTREQCFALQEKRHQTMKRRELLADLFLDWKLTWRSLVASPAFTLGTVLTLALAIGGTTAVFSVVYGVLLKPLPLPKPDRLVHLFEENPEKGWDNVAAPANFLDWRARSKSFEDLTAAGSFEAIAALSGDGDPEPIRGGVIYPNYFSVLGVTPLLGRTFREEEAWTGAFGAVLISERLWKKRFGGDPALVGKTVAMNGRDREVVGVIPAGFAFPFPDLDFWTPFTWEPGNREAVWFRRAHFVLPIGRLKPGISVASAQAELKTLAAQLSQEYPETNKVMGAGLMPLSTWMGRDRQLTLWLLLGAVGLVLAVACTNIAHLQLTRATPRRGEMAVKTALGASRGRLVRQMLTESLALFSAGGGLGLLVALGLLEALLALAPADLPRRAEIALHIPVVVFALVLTFLCALVFGLVPALSASRGAHQGLLTQTGRGFAGSRRSGWQGSLLAAGEVALALMVTLAAGLVIRSLGALERVDPGFEGDRVMTAQVRLPGARYPDQPQALAFFDQLYERLAGRPAIEALGFADALPMTGTNWTSDFSIESRGPDEAGFEVNHRSVSPSYFDTMGVPVASGRGFETTDIPGSPRVVLINQALAQRFFPNRDPIGERLCFDRVPTADSVWRTIVGVVGDEKQEGLGKPTRIEILTPFAQDADGAGYVVLRTAGEPVQALAELRAAVQEIDRTLALFDVATLDQRVQRSLSRERFLTRLLTLFAAFALGLAAIGIYSVLAYGVSRRKREIGIRMALGARGEAVLTWVLRQAVTALAIGLAVGLAGSFACSRLIVNLLYGISPTDPATYAGVCTVLVTAGLAASLLPARRATRVDPALTLKGE